MEDVTYSLYVQLRCAKPRIRRGSVYPYRKSMYVCMYACVHVRVCPSADSLD